MSKASHNCFYRQFQILNLTISAFIIILLSACGGGDGGNEEPTPVIPPSLVSIDSSNAIHIAAKVTEIVLGTDDLSNSIDFTNPNVQEPINMSNPTAMSAAMSRTQNTLIGIIINNTPIEPETFDCFISGSQTLSGDLADLNTVTAGDVINIESNMCDDGFGEVIDGLLAMTIVRIEGDINSSEFLLGVEVKFTELMTTTESESITFNGDISMIIDTLSPPFEALEISGNNLTIKISDNVATMSDFLDIYTVDTSTFPVAWQQSSKGSLTTNEITGSANYETTVTFIGWGEDYPHTGELFITGANNASISFMVIDAENIQIDADYDGDNVVDETFYLTWIELEEYS